MKNQSVRQLICYILVSMLAFAGLVSQTHAVMIGTDTVAAEVASDLGREEIKSLLARQDVSDKLASLGVDIADVSDRVDLMSDAEVAELNQQMNDLPAGGVLGTIALVLLILILLDIAGVTDIFSGV